MSCEAVAFSAMLWLASTSPAPAPTAVAAFSAPASVAGEPLFADIVRRAGGLKAQAEAYRKTLAADPAAPAAALKGVEVFGARIAELSALDMKGHVTLKERGAVDDLKCILRGIAGLQRSLPVRQVACLGQRTPSPRWRTSLRGLDARPSMADRPTASATGLNSIFRTRQ